MNKTAIKSYAIWARVTLIDAVKQRAYQYEINKDSIAAANADVISGKPLSKDEKEQRRQLIEQINIKGFDQVMEEVAYTWFNRFIALRFMEVNGYLPTKVRVFTDGEGNFKPEILKEALSVELPVDKTKVMELLEKQDNEELYKMLLIAQCNELSFALPDMFEVISNYTELLFPNNLLKEDSVLGQMVNSIPEEDWTDAVQIIGWLYQYYNSELKDETFALLKKNVKISKDRIPAATQLFTPDWIVRYMVENSLGRLWYEGHPNEEIKKNWKYYLDEAEQEHEVEEELKKIREEYKTIRPEDIKVIDPCMGSGHILVYAFDVLMQIYTSAGWSERDAAESILENNLYGLDIDDRAGQLAYFAVMMKARKYSRRILTKSIRPKVFSIQESNNVKINAWWRLGSEEDIARRLIRDLTDAKEYGSILNLSVTMEEMKALRERLDDIDRMSDMGNLLDMAQSDEITRQLYPLVELAEVMVQKYDVVVTNPPYMGGSGMNPCMSDYIRKNYSDYKADLFSAFIFKCCSMLLPIGFAGFLSPFVWMFIQTYEKLRDYIINQVHIQSLIHFEYSAFEEATVPICSFVLQHLTIRKNSSFVRLTDYRGGMKVQQTKALEAINNRNCGYFYVENTTKFEKIPGTPIAYWLGDRIYDYYTDCNTLSKAISSQVGSTLGDNGLFMRMWFEVEKGKRSKWFLTHKGGSYRRWYGNESFVVNWENGGKAVKDNGRATVRGEKTAFDKGITWTQLTAGNPSFRIKEEGTFIESASCMCKIEDGLYEYLLGFLNTKITTFILDAFNPTMHFQPGDIGRLPWNVNEDEKERITALVRECIDVSRTDWDSNETSLEFKQTPLI